mmetsp:Transcript_16603/g.19207  ORF Transcript_16603/g.19207 Transcript_16603/m.19207 type:complete len:224 (+) Transcript_16603:367-1038(+)
MDIYEKFVYEKVRQSPQEPKARPPIKDTMHASELNLLNMLIPKEHKLQTHSSTPSKPFAYLTFSDWSKTPLHDFTHSCPSSDASIKSDYTQMLLKYLSRAYTEAAHSTCRLQTAVQFLLDLKKVVDSFHADFSSLHRQYQASPSQPVCVFNGQQDDEEEGQAAEWFRAVDFCRRKLAVLEEHMEMAGKWLNTAETQKLVAKDEQEKKIAEELYQVSQRIVFQL